MDVRCVRLTVRLSLCPSLSLARTVKGRQERKMCSTYIKWNNYIKQKKKKEKIEEEKKKEKTTTQIENSVERSSATARLSIQNEQLDGWQMDARGVRK